MAVLAAAELTAVVGEDGFNSGAVSLEGGQDVVVHQVDGGDRQLVGVERGPGVATVAVDGGLQVELADALEDADEVGVDGDQRAGMWGSM